MLLSTCMLVSIHKQRSPPFVLVRFTARIAFYLVPSNAYYTLLIHNARSSISGNEDGRMVRHHPVLKQWLTSWTRGCLDMYISMPNAYGCLHNSFQLFRLWGCHEICTSKHHVFWIDNGDELSRHSKLADIQLTSNKILIMSASGHREIKNIGWVVILEG